MRVDKSLSIYTERPDALTEFDRTELKRCRLLLRRLQFLEAKVRENGGLANGGDSGAAAFTEWEVEALEWVLGPEGVDFLVPIDENART